MSATPQIGTVGGQHYNIVRAIHTFLAQMGTEIGFRCGPAVIKELIQNADDAGASELGVVLDERSRPQGLPPEYDCLVGPALLIRNNASFRTGEDAESNDFLAICDVAGGHKLQRATAAGRFGIGFNSVYFLTDTPIIFSRREVHIFDLLHYVFKENGWKFPLDAFPSHASGAGPIKQVLEWTLPKSVIHEVFGDLAQSGRDYQQSVFRLPLRLNAIKGERLADETFPTPESRQVLLREICVQAAQSMLFLKSVEKISISCLTDNGSTLLATAVVTPNPIDFEQFRKAIDNEAAKFSPGQALVCGFYERAIELQSYSGDIKNASWSFFVKHAAHFEIAALCERREHLHRNRERAIPWVSLAIPRDLDSLHFEGNAQPYWRVFLPLGEEGPCGCVLNAHLFVGPSRQRAEFKTGEASDDEALRKTGWNKSLVDEALIPMLSDASAEMLQLIPEIVQKSPREYLSLLPKVLDSREPKTIAEYVRQQFTKEVRILKVFDLWENPLELLLGQSGELMQLEMVPEWVATYRHLFEHLTTPARSFVTYSLGDGLREYLPKGSPVRIQRHIGSDVAREILSAETAPRYEDLKRLLERLDPSELTKVGLEGLWCFQGTKEEEVLKFAQDTLFLAGATATHAILLELLRSIGLSFRKTQWVKKEVGLCALSESQRSDFDQLRLGDDTALLALLRRVENTSHDLVSNSETTRPLIEFLCEQGPERLDQELHLSFLVTTATNKLSKRGLGTIFLKPTNPTRDEEVLWEGLLRRTFAEVQPSFANGLHQLLEHAPELLRCLDAKDCRLEIVRVDCVFDALVRAMDLSARTREDFLRELNRPGEVHSSCRNEAYGAALLILEEAERRWDQLNEEERRTVLRLPIHRLADGALVSLINDEHTTIESLKQTYFLQSEDDLSDAPLRLEGRTLLHSVDRIARRFYRTRLQISEHGRIEVLKEALRQIGTDPATAEALLAYVAKHYEDTIEQLTVEGTDGKTDAETLRELFCRARLVPCLDTMWHRLEESIQASVAAHQLKRQGWKDGELEKILTYLAHPRAVATLDVDLFRFVAQLHSLQFLPPSDLGLLAITSEAETFGLQERAKIFLNNTPPSTVSAVRALVLEKIPCPALTGSEVKLQQLELLELSKSTLRASLLGWMFPNAVDVVAIAKRLGVEGQEAARFLKALKVPVCTDNDLDEILVTNVVNIWPRLTDGERIEILAYIGSKDTLAERLRARAVELDVVRVGGGKWVSPGEVISPEWARTQPPVSPYQIAMISDVPAEVLYLWNKWCGLNTIGQVVEYVTGSLQSIADDLRVQSWKDMVRWLNRVLQKIGAKQTAEALKGQAWVLAKRDSEHRFQTAEETLSHPGADLLSRKFWVVYGDTPTTLKQYVQFWVLPADPQTVEAIAECLADATNFTENASLSVYQEVSRLIDQEEKLAQVWERSAQRMPVYRVFRTPDSWVTSAGLFLGDREHASDFGEFLRCFSQGGMDEFHQAVRRIYKRLGVPVRPSPEQLSWALGKICGHGSRLKNVHRDLVEALTSLNSNPAEICSEKLSNLGVLSCSGTYEPLCSCYLDDDLRSPELIDEESRSRLIDRRDRPTSKLLKWIGDRSSIVRHLRLNADRVLLEEPPTVTLSAELMRVVQPWRSWLGQLANEEAALRAEVSGITIWNLPRQRIELVPVDEIRIRYELEDGVVLPSSEWTGPHVCHDAASRIFIAKRVLDEAASNKLEKVDEAVANEIFELLRHLNGAPTTDSIGETFKDVARRTLERPSAVLRRMKLEKEEHFFHQYLDQAADPEFADTFDEYHQLSPNSPKREELRDTLWKIIADKFVHARREQIRGYGYDEFSIFAELVQNAEDAYAQRMVLGMDSPPERSLTFSYSRQDSNRVLTVEHWGRPFNYWIHGAKSEQAYKRDVEGVLKSAGSFKPHVKIEDQSINTVGRFGLGFKSVYLITAQPTVHSGDWHFTIKSGCIPEEVDVPNDLGLGRTRFVLPLLDEAQEEEDRRRGEGERFVNLVPFLRQIDELNLKRSDDTSLKLQVRVQGMEGNTGDETVIEKVQVSGPTHVRGRTVDFVRLRDRNNDAQLALYLGEDGLPASWKEAFLWDAFAVLPLRIELGCGVAVSHMFQVQSGRTHLIDAEANREKVAEVSALIQAIPQAINALLSDQLSRFDFLRRFWSIWRWDRGDSEATELRRGLAKELVALAERAQVVPTLNRDEIVSLDGRPLFCFERIPEEFGVELLAAAAEVSTPDHPIILRDTNVVPEWFLSAYDRICAAAKSRSSHFPQRIGWSDVGRLCLNRALLAEKPTLVSIMARTLAETEIPQVVEWLAKCLLRTADGGSDIVSNTLPWSFSGVDHLPARLMRRLDRSYDDDAVDLLKRAGLRSRPSVEDLETWIGSELQAHECIGLIRYLSDQGRWRRDFYRVAPKLHRAWFETGNGRVSSAEAFERGLITLDLVNDPLFRAWLGIRIGEDSTPAPEPPTAPRELNNLAVLEAIYRWWSADRVALTRKYDARVYPDSTPPRIRRDFLPSNGRDRESWLVLLILGATHTMGRTRPEQHREFVRQCQNRGWLEVFADPTLRAEKWMGILESYLGAQVNEAIFFEWVKQFVSIFQLARWLEDYVEAFLSIDRLTKPFSLDSVTRLGASDLWQGGGPNAPSLTRTLGMGACFVVRELVRLGVLRSEYAFRHAFVPSLRVREIFTRLGCLGVQDNSSYGASTHIYRFLLEKFGNDQIAKVTFDRSFDLPFLIIADDPGLQSEFFDSPLSYEEELT